MLSHVTVGSNDLLSAIAFYDLVLGAIGVQRRATDIEEGWVAYAHPDRPDRSFWVVRPYDGGPATPGNGVTIALEAHDHVEVRAFHAAALAAGGRDEGGPGLRPHYHRSFYAAYVRDLDGNKLCCVCHRAPD